MGQAFDRDGNVLGEAYGATKREVFDKLAEEFKDAHEIRIRSLDDRLRAAERSEGPLAAQSELPRYRSHKTVWALKIRAVIPPTEGPAGMGWIVPDDAGYGPIEVSAEYLQKHKPVPGGYYVVYKDGYQSFSPAAAFEDGYTRI